MLKKLERIILILSVILFCLESITCAEEKVKADWINEIEVSYIQSDGNSAHRTLGNTYTVKRITPGSILQEKISITYTETPSGEVIDHVFLKSNYTYTLSEQWFAYNDSLIEIDKLSGMKLNSNSFFGAGWQYNLGNLAIRLQSGMGESYEHRNREIDIIATSEKSSANIKYALTKNFIIYADANAIYSFRDLNDYKARGEAGWKIKLTKMLSLRNSLGVRYNNTPPVDILKVNTFFKTALVFIF